ncbi:hypothetical protein ACYF6T_21305 [Streptomyces sp. 7R007]
MNVIAELVMPPLYKGGVPIVCPVCAQHEDLTLVIDTQDFSDAPSVLKCDDMHQWSEPRVPRRIGAELAAIKERDQPEMIRWPDGHPTPPVPPRRFRRRRRRG